MKESKKFSNQERKEEEKEDRKEGSNINNFTTI